MEPSDPLPPPDTTEPVSHEELPPTDEQPEPEPPVAERPPSPVLAPPVDAALQKRMRAFIALNLPLPLVRKVIDEVAAMKVPIAASGAKVAWVPAANVHLTLKFLGAIRPEAAEAIAGSLRRGLAGRPPFEVEVSGMGAFPSASQPRVLWAGLRESAALSALQKDVEGWMEALGFLREERPFHAHLTVGRVTDLGASGSGVVEAQLSPRQTMLFGAGRVSEVVLYESRTLARGAEYRPLARVMLGQPQQF